MHYVQGISKARIGGMDWNAAAPHHGTTVTVDVTVAKFSSMSLRNRARVIAFNPNR